MPIRKRTFDDIVEKNSAKLKPGRIPKESPRLSEEDSPNWVMHQKDAMTGPKDRERDGDDNPWRSIKRSLPDTTLFVTCPPELYRLRQEYIYPQLIEAYGLVAVTGVFKRFQNPKNMEETINLVLLGKVHTPVCDRMDEAGINYNTPWVEL